MVHPHACGELTQEKPRKERAFGSSPRMWGTPPSSTGISAYTRFIPTHVGNSAPSTSDAPSSPVHPHACGELISYLRSITCSAGSSPRMWGTPTIAVPVLSLSWFIPTHVGNSFFIYISEKVLLVHPHACGELGVICRYPVVVAGSSPRMWGTLTRPRFGYNLRWFIPTHVGNSGVSLTEPGASLVHPHACGELFLMVYSVKEAYGSSPRMWGTLFGSSSFQTYIWFIPTHVGNSWFSAIIPHEDLVHPHACGELLSDLHVGSLWGGSSPRMWGTPLPYIYTTSYPWFIPTHVGNSYWRCMVVSGTEVHPHACGELQVPFPVDSTPNGSSPRMWGTPMWVLWIHWKMWFIPTHVGNSFTW